MWNLN